MKHAILIFLTGILSVNSAVVAQELEYPRWRCDHNRLISFDLQAVRTDEGFSCWAQCEAPAGPFHSPLGDQRIHACLNQVLSDDIGLDEQACEASLGVPSQCVPSSGGGSSNNSTKALIAGGVAIAAVAVVKYLSPDFPEGVNVRPEANIAYRDGLAMSTAGIVGGLAELGVFRRLRQHRTGLDETLRPGPMVVGFLTSSLY